MSEEGRKIYLFYFDDILLLMCVGHFYEILNMQQLINVSIAFPSDLKNI
jgi:hypothetical protein